MDVLKTFFTNAVEVRHAAKLLFDTGCCTRCALRFLGEKQVSVFQIAHKDLNALLDDNTNQSLDERNAEFTLCTACLGMLQDDFATETIDFIIKSIESSKHQYETFMCSVSVPVSTIIRKHSIWLHMKESFREIYAGYDESDIVDVKDAWKWMYGPVISDKLSVPFDMKSTFTVSISFVHPQADSECAFLRRLLPKRKQRNHRQINELFTRMGVTKILADIKDDEFKTFVQTPPSLPVDRASCDIVQCSHDSIFIAGRYNKFSRTLSQTPWLIDGTRKSPTSVEELISETLLMNFRAKASKFSSSGREDVDVRMLGQGRPFILEILDPHSVSFTQEQMSAMEDIINQKTEDVFVRDLQIVSRDETSLLKLGEQTKTKRYSALCWSERTLDRADMKQLSDMTDIKIFQKTPIRVLHRRNISTREKTIHSLSGVLVDDHHFRLDLSTQAGTYIKEFVHGDLGRTFPNLGCFLQSDCDILELDVEEINIDWPRKISKPSDDTESEETSETKLI